MGNDHPETPTGRGLELDKIEFPAQSSQNSIHNPTPDPVQKPIFPPETGSSPKKHLRLTLIAILTVLVLLIGFVLYQKRQDLKISSFSTKKTVTSENYLRVGPVSITLKNQEMLRLSVDIECGNKRIKNKLAEKDSRIRDKIVSIITAPDTEILLEQRQYAVVRTKIKDSLGKMYGDSIGEIYFSELITYY